MTYLESAQGKVISHERAIKELRNHDIFDNEDFYFDMGIHNEYDAGDVLELLGY